ncbi:hypothetical protein VTO73DRAFT_10222 [Trametes versicolor]
MSSDTAVNSSKYSVPKLESDGSNWITYRERMKVVQTAKGLMPHIRGTSRKPPYPPPFERDLPHIPSPTTVPRADGAGDAATPGEPGPGSDSDSRAPATQARARDAPPTDEYSHLTDEQYAELVDKMEAKFNLWETKEAGARALIYETLSDDLFIEVQSRPTAKGLWEAVVASCENKSLMYANAIRTRIQNTRCPEGGDVRAHLALLQREKQNLAAVGSRLDDSDFAAIITNSLPESYFGRVQTIVDISSISGQTIPIEFLVNKLNEEYDRRAINKANEIALASVTASPASGMSASGAPGSRSNVECYNCHGIGHIARNCRRKGGGKEGQWSKGRDGGGGNVNANAATERHHGFVALGNTVASALAASPGSYVDVFDSGASIHISPYRERFTTFQELTPPRPITAANGDEFLATGQGDVEICVPNGGASRMLTLRNVLYSSSVAFALVSIRKADEGGYTTVFEQGECKIVDRASNTNIARIPITAGLYQVVSQYVETYASAAATALSTSSRPGSKRLLKVTPYGLHRCLTHISLKAARDLVKDGHVTGVELLDGPIDQTCDVCIQAKITRKAIPDEAHPAPHDIPIVKYGEKVHSDTWDSNTLSLGGNGKSTLFVDEHTRSHHGFPIKSITETLDAYKNLEAAILTQTGTQVKWFHSDNGGEYIGELKKYVTSRGTHWSASVPHTPEQNGIAERAHRVHRERVSAMLLDAGLPQTLWAHAYKHSIYVHNRTGHSALDGKTPYEARFGTPPDIRHLRPWGTRVWARQESSRKLEPRGVAGHFVGFSENHRDGIHVYWPERRNVTVVRNYVWGEEVEPAPSTAQSDDAVSEGARIEEVESEADFDVDADTQGAMDGVDETEAVSEQGKGADEDKDAIESADEENAQAAPEDAEAAEQGEGEPDMAEEIIEEAPQEPPMGRGHRVRMPSARARRILEGEGTTGARRRTREHPRGVIPEAIMGALAALETPLEDSDVSESTCSSANISSDWGATVHGLVAQAGGDPLSGDPTSLREAQAAPDWPQWEAAIAVEMDNLRAHGTYDLVVRPPSAHVIGSRLVFHRKRDANGAVKQCKVRVVAQGFGQIPGVDYNETFAPVAKSSSLRLMIALAARHGWPLIQLDVKSAYLNGELDEEIYMRQPPGTAARGEEHLVCRLKKSLYGLKQAGREWYKTYRAAMTKLGMTRSEADHACFWTHDGESLAMVGTIVDDMLVTGTPDLVERFRTGIKGHFTVTDAGEVAWLLGIEVVRDVDAGTVRLAQRSAIDTVVRAMSLEGAKPAGTPIAVGGVLDKSQCPTTANAIADMARIPYREGVGMCMYIAVTTRPDIAYAVHRLASYMSNPGRPHWEALKRLVRYLLGTRDLWLVYGSDTTGLAGYTDADWGTSEDSRHSVCGYVYTFDGGAVSWSAKKQSVVALSSTEAEYIGITHAAKEAMWLKALLGDLVHPDFATHAVRLYSDNKSAMDLARNNAFHARTKHIAIRFHFIREAVERGDIDLGYRRTEDMPADVFTKPLTRGKLDHLGNLFGLRAF